MPIEYYFSGLLIKMENDRGHDRERYEISTYVYIYMYICTHRWRVNHHQFMQGRDDACSLLLFSIMFTLILIIVLIVIITIVITAVLLLLLGFWGSCQLYRIQLPGRRLCRAVAGPCCLMLRWGPLDIRTCCLKRKTLKPKL